MEVAGRPMRPAISLTRWTPPPMASRTGRTSSAEGASSCSRRSGSRCSGPSGSRIRRSIRSVTPSRTAGGELPVPRHAAPRGVGLDELRFLAVRKRGGKPRRIQRTELEEHVRTSVERRLGGQHEPLHHALAGSGDGDDQLRSPRVVVQPALQHARQLGRRGDEIRQLVEDERASPCLALRIPRQARQQGVPALVANVGEAGQALGYRAREVPALDVGRRLVGHGVEAAGPPRPLEQEPRLPDPPPSVEDGQPALWTRGEREQPLQLGFPVEE